MRVLSLVDSPDDIPLEEHVLKSILVKYRIEATVEVIVRDMEIRNKSQSAAMNQFLKQYSSESSNISDSSILTLTGLIFLPMAVPPDDETMFVDYLNDLDTLTADLPPTVLVHGVSVVLTNEL